MTAIHAEPPRFDAQPQALLERASALGFSLATRVTDTGQTVWEWRRGLEPRPQFVTQRVALRWMAEWIANHERAR